MLIIAAIFLQKVGFTIGGGSVGLSTFILWGVMIWIVTRGLAVLDIERLWFFTAFIASIALSVLLSIGNASVGSLGILVSLYAAMLFRVDLKESTFKRCLSKYQNAMFWIAWIVIAQQASQYTIGSQTWPNLDNLLPEFLLIKGYAYLRPYSWNSQYLTPNGIFFLEPSTASACLAVSMCCELLIFKRIKRLILLLIAIIVGVAGTGPTILLLCAPALIARTERKILRALAIGCLPLFFFAFIAGFLSHYIDRSSEFSQDSSSAHARFIVPFYDSLHLLDDQMHLISGNGAGSTPKMEDLVEWPLNKLLLEYGLLCALSFHVFLVIAVLRRSPSKIVATVVLIPHLFFGGGIVSHANIMMLVIFGSLIRIAPSVDSSGQAFPTGS